MNAFLRTGILILVVLLGLSGISFAKQVFLQDGSVLDCESFWRRNNHIIVKVNRDVLLQFTPGEVDLSKTFKTKPKPRHIKRKNHGSHSGLHVGPATRVPDAAVQGGAHRGVSKPAPRSAPDPTPAAEPAPSPSVDPAPVVLPGAQEAAQHEPAQVASTDPSPVLTKAELERRTRENAALMADAIQKQDPELIKKALEAQRSMVQQQRAAHKNLPPKAEPVWFKYLLMLAVSGLLIIIAMWVVFEKAGQPGVKSVIPFYNMYVLMEISGKPGWWFILLFVPLVGAALYLLAMLSLAEKFDRSAAFGVGLLFLPMLFFPMLAFGGSQYGGVREDLNFTFSQ